MAKSMKMLASLLLPILLLLLANQTKLTEAKLNSTEFINSALEGHNAARKAVGVPPLVWEPLLATYARIYSSKQRRQDCKLVHSEGVFGENLFWGEGKSWSIKDAVAAWVAEKEWYDYSYNSCKPGAECGHYTQIVWKQTIRVGCSQIRCDSGDTFITCEYYPAGNYEGENPY